MVNKHVFNPSHHSSGFLFRLIAVFLYSFFPAAMAQQEGSAPVATLSLLSTQPGATDVEVGFSKPVTGLSLSDFTAVNMTLAAVSGSGDRYTLRLTTGNPAGSGGLLTLLAGAVTDADGNTNAAASRSVGIAPPGPTPVTLQNPGTQTGTHGSAVSLQITGSNFSVMTAQGLPAGLTMSLSGLITGIIDQSAAASSLVTVTAQHTTFAAQSAVTRFTWLTQSPLTVSMQVLSLAQASAQIEVLFSRPVTGLEQNDFTPVNCTISSLTGSGDRYTVGVVTGNPAGSSGTLNLRAAAAADAAGATHAAATVSFALSPPAPIPPSIEHPGVLTSVRGAAVNLRISASNFQQLFATNLPAGLTMDTTGLITGTVAETASDTYIVRFTARRTSPQLVTAFIDVRWNTTAPRSLTERGLLAEYFPNPDLSGSPVFTRTETQIYHEWQDGSPSPALPVDGFSARWSGTITARYSETYTLIVQADDAARLWVDDVKVLDTFSAFGGGTAEVFMTAGKPVPIRLEFRETGGWASVLLAWSSNSQGWQQVPVSALLTGEPVTLATPLAPVEQSLGLASGSGGGSALTFFRAAGDRSGMLVQVSEDLNQWITISADDPAWTTSIGASPAPGLESVRVERVSPVNRPREFFRVILPGQAH